MSQLPNQPPSQTVSLSHSFEVIHKIGDDTPILFLHGIGGNAHNFDQIMARLKGRDCYGLNLPGYGGAPYEGTGFTFANIADSLAGFIDGLNGKVHVVGHSIGGMIALEHGVRYPHQLASLSVLGATSAFGGRDDSFKDAFLKARLGPLDAGQTMAEMARIAAPDLVAPDASSPVLSAVEESLASVPIDIWRAILRCLVTFNRREDMANLAIPTLVIAGKHDKNAPPQSLAKMVDVIPNAQFSLIEKAGHILPLEAPREIGQVLTNFWSGLKI